jgi:hypothetical protein
MIRLNRWDFSERLRVNTRACSAPFLVAPPAPHCTSSGATIPGMRKLAEEDLEDDSPDPTNIPTRDLNRQVRRLAEAVLLRAVLDSRLPAGCYQHDAVQFLYPESEDARRHLLRIAELAGLPPAWLNERLASSAGMPLPTIRKCTNARRRCRSAILHLVMTTTWPAIVVVVAR